MKFTKLALLASVLALAMSAQAKACGEEEQAEADGSYAMQAVNMECSSKNGVKIFMEYSWGSCLTSQSVYISGGRQAGVSYVNSARGETPRADILRSKTLDGDGQLFTFQHENSPAVSASLLLTRDARHDGEGVDFKGEKAFLPAYTGILERAGQKTRVSCRTLPQQH